MLFTAFIVLISLSGCNNEGIVGEGISPDGDKVETTSIDVTNLEVLENNGFSGQLTNNGIGIVEDPAYGNITSVALLKPSIGRDDLEFFPSGYTFKLQLEFNPLKYGDENSTSNYVVYEIDQLWRGEQLRYNYPVTIDESSIIGSFQVGDESSVEVDLSQDWVDRYREFFNNESTQRDSTYRFEFPGLAIAPENQNQKIDFLRHTAAEDDTTNTGVTRFLIENDQDSLVATIPVVDQGASMQRTDVPEPGNDIVLHNTMETILKLDLDTDAALFEGKEIVNATLVFNKKPVQTAPAFTRPSTDLLRAHFFSSEPADLASEIFVRAPSLGATLSEENENLFEINVTNYLVDKLFGDVLTTPLYLTNQGNNGLYYSTTLHGTNAFEDLRPHLIITTINPEN